MVPSPNRLTRSKLERWSQPVAIWRVRLRKGTLHEGSRPRPGRRLGQRSDVAPC